MGRPNRLQHPGAVYHIGSRGNERRDTFRDDADRQLFYWLLGESVRRFNWILTAYVLMSNHFHLLVELTEANLSRAMQWLNGRYARAFNRRHERDGHLYGRRFWSRPVDKENYFLTGVRYVVLNPVRAGMVAGPEEYPWSSYRATAGEAPVPEWLAVDEVLVRFGEDRLLARARYRAFVQEGIGRNEVPWSELIETNTEVDDRVQPRPRPAGNRSSRSMCDVTATVARAFRVDERLLHRGRGGAERMLAAWLGRYEAHLELDAIGSGLGLRSPGYVSALIQQCEKQIRDDSTIREQADRCIALLHQL